MTHSFDAIVVGAGLNGAATAYFLAAKGFGEILVVDADTIGAGASGAAVGLLRSHYDNRHETELAAKSLPYFRNWTETVGGSCGWMPTGFFRFVEPDELSNMQSNVAVQREFGEPVEILSAAEARRIAPEFDIEGVGAVVYEPASGTADNLEATVSMLRIACGRGVELWPFTRAIAVETRNGRVQGLATTRGRMAAPIVVLAAGAGCKALAASCGIELPLVEKTIRVAEIIPPRSIRLSVSYMDPISDSWIAPRPQGRAIVAVPPSPGMSGPPNPNFSREEAANGLPPVAKRLPAIGDATLVRWWGRSDCFAPDGKPIIGAVDGVEGLYLNTAGAGKGHKVAPAAGLALSELIADGAATSVGIVPFGLARLKQTPRPWSSSEYRKRVIG